MQEKQKNLGKPYIFKAFLTVKRWLPRSEWLILLAGFLFTLLGKFIIIQRQSSSGYFVELIYALFPDVLFFGFFIMLINALYIIKPSKQVARAAILIATLITLWSVSNAGWLVKCGTQLQVAVLAFLARDFMELWPLIWRNLSGRWDKICIFFAMVAVVFYLLFRLVYPRKVSASKKNHFRWIAATAVIMVALLLANLLVPFKSTLGFTGQAVSFSSHWYVLTTLVTGVNKDRDITVKFRNVPIAGQRDIKLPKCSIDQLPNIILVLLESISSRAYLAGNPNTETMPNLAKLAREGVLFPTTRISTARTTKTIWAILTSTTPSMQSNYVESVLVDKPYEGLPTILKKLGYRSAHFEMGRGTCECAPAFYKNMSFDWAWFRENLNDPSSYLGHFGGDDCRMIAPAIEWARQDSRPFLLSLTTTVAHGPSDYFLPESFAKQQGTKYEKFLRAVNYTDYFVGLLCRELKKCKLDKNTILCFVGDHGGSFRDGGDNQRWVPYEEVVVVPWILHWPGHIKAGQVITYPCSEVDIAPTILKLMGFDITKAAFEGRDAFVPSTSSRRFYFSSWYFNSPIGFVEENRKIIYWPYLDKIFEYDLETDPNEDNPKNVSAKESEKIKKDLMRWEKKTQIKIDPKRYTESFLYSHWQTFSAGQNAWAYYVP